MSENAAGKSSLPIRIAIGLAVGAVAGVLARAWLAGDEEGARRLDWISANIAAPVGNIFLNLMFMVVLPLIFSSLALGVAGLGDVATVGRLGARLLLGTLLLTGAGVGIGLALVNVVRPGEGLNEPDRAALIERTRGEEVEKRLAQAHSAKSTAQVISDFVTRNPLEDAVNMFNPNPNYRGGGIIAFMVFTAIVGIAIAAIGPSQAEPVTRLLEAVQALSHVVIGFAMRLAPFGVAALIFQTTSKIGLQVFNLLGKYVLVVLAGLALQLILTYSVALIAVARRSPLKFFASIQEVLITAFSTSSSNATLPTSLRVAETKLGLPKEIAGFTLTVGATANQNGTALFEGVTVLFLAQFFGVELALSQQLTVVGMSILAGVGTAGVPGGSIPLIALLLETVGIPAAGIGIILGVDRILDMSRTVVNVVGDLVLATMVAPAVTRAADSSLP